MLRRLGIRGKVLAALSVPVLVLFGLAGLVSWEALQDVRASRAVQDVLDAVDQSRRLASALQDERSVTVEHLGPLGATEDQVVSARETTDTAIARFKTVAARVDVDSLDPTVGAAIRRLNGQLGVLNSARTFADGRQVAASVVQYQYDSVVREVVEFPRDIAEGLTDRQLAQDLTALANVDALVEAYEGELVTGREAIAAVHAGEPDVAALTRLSEAILDSNDLRLEIVGELSQLGLDEDRIPSETILVTGEEYDFGEYRRSMDRLDEASLALLTYVQSLQPNDWVVGAQNEIDALAPTATAIRDMSVSRATVVANAALREAALSISVTALAVIVSIVVALSIARAIVRPIRRLTEAAAVVRDELPNLVEQVAIPGQGPDLRLTKIPVESRDEVGRLAAAFNEVNATTIEVAQEQAALRASIAEMFVNVARRDQVLLNRQLSFIDALERSEEDPKTLADLFRLDHLATRMRRNSESLLVLAGIDTGRRLRDPLPTSDVIRTASSEIEHYERVQLELPVDPMMLGHTALPTAHMLAEILENATVFSDPGTPVHVSTGIDEESVIITVRDQGLGMTPEELAQANSRLQTTSASEVLGAQRLGLYVVGRIAARLGASVVMENGSDGKGLLVTVRMPKVLFVNPDAIPITPPTAAPALVESFVAPEQAAAVVHDGAYVPTGVQDVAPGALGSVENPAQAVDLSQLVEGTTQTGLPKRRASAGEAAPAWDMGASEAPETASAIPLAPAPEALAGAALAGATEVWQPPIVETSTPLVPRRRAEQDEQAPAAGLPQRQPAAPEAAAPAAPAAPATTPSGLPTRRPAAPAAPAAQEAVDASRASGPANVEGRTAMFTGFRSRRAELAAAAIHEAGESTGESTDELGATDAVDRLAAAATGAAAFFQRPAPPGQEPPVYESAGTVVDESTGEQLVIPALVEDEDDFGDPAFAPDAPAPAAQVAEPEVAALRPAEEVPFEVFAAEPAPTWPPAPAAEAPAWAPEQPAAETPAWAPEQPTPETWAPEQPAAPAAQAPVWAPEQPAAQAPVWAPDAAPAPVAEQPAWGAPAPEATPWATAPAPSAPAPQPTWTAAPEQPAWPAAEVPVPAAAPVAPVAPEQPAPAPFAATDVPQVAFSDLVQGPTRRSMRERGEGKRRLFRRSRKAETPAPAAPTAPAAPAVPAVPVAPVAAVPAAPVAPLAAPAPAAAEQSDFPVFAPPPAPVYVPPPVTEQPVRQSAWGGPTTGSHAVVEPPAAEPQPAFEPEPAPAESAAQAPIAPEAPAAPAQPDGAWQPAGGAWSPEAWSVPTPAPAPASETVTPSPIPATPPAAATPAPYVGAQSFTPEPSFGLDEEMTSMLAQRADIAQQALAELSQLSTYRPAAVEKSSSSKLQRRTPSAVPAAPAIKTTSATPRPARDANQVRSLLSSFQSGTSRGRKLAGNDAPQSPGENGLAGSEERPDGTGQPVAIPDADLSTRDATW